MESSLTPVQKLTRTRPRTFGVIALALGAAIASWTILAPIQQAQSHEAHIRISTVQTLVGVMLLLLGAVYLAFGARVAAMFHPAEGESKIPAYAAGTVMGLVGLAIYVALKGYLQAQGYVFGR